jgi:hypothetical protein
MTDSTIYNAKDHVDFLSVNNIHVIDNFLQPDDLKYTSNYIISQREHHNRIISDKAITDFIWSRYKSVLKQYNISCVHDYVTVTYDKKPIGPHKDKILNNEKYRLIIYLNKVDNGGTIFYVDDKKYLVDNQVNRLVIFDINLYHRAELPSTLEYSTQKMLIGIRGS